MKSKKYAFCIVFWLALGIYCFGFDRVLLIGDSVSTGYGLPAGSSFVDRIAVDLRYQRPKLRLIRHCREGLTVSETRVSIGSILRKSGAPNMAIIAVGGNDYRQKRPSKDVEDDLAVILDYIRKANKDCQVVILGFGFVEGGSPYETFSNHYLTVVRTGFECFNPSRSDLRLEDGIHPNIAGQNELYETLVSAIKHFKEKR
jgi:acyl-CoA thioesterase I